MSAETGSGASDEGPFDKLVRELKATHAAGMARLQARLDIAHAQVALTEAEAEGERQLAEAERTLRELEATLVAGGTKAQHAITKTEATIQYCGSGLTVKFKGLPCRDAAARRGILGRVRPLQRLLRLLRVR